LLTALSSAKGPNSAYLSALREADQALGVCDRCSRHFAGFAADHQAHQECRESFKELARYLTLLFCNRARYLCFKAEVEGIDPRILNSINEDGLLLLDGLEREFKALEKKFSNVVKVSNDRIAQSSWIGRASGVFIKARQGSTEALSGSLGALSRAATGSTVIVSSFVRTTLTGPKIDEQPEPSSENSKAAPRQTEPSSSWGSALQGALSQNRAQQKSN